MSYVIYAKGVSNRFDEFVRELCSGLAMKGVNLSNQSLGTNEQHMSVEYTDERGDMNILSSQPDIKVSYTASGGPETLKGAVTGAAAGGGLGVLTSVLTGRTSADRIMGGIAGAVTGGAVGGYKGHEKGMREKISFARLLARTVTESERRLLNLERKETLEKIQSNRLRENLLNEKNNTESVIQRSLGQLESMKTEEESRKTSAEASHLERIARLEGGARDQELKDRLVAAENKRFEAELKRIESFYVMRASQVNSSMSRLKQRISNIEDKLANM